MFNKDGIDNSKIKTINKFSNYEVVPSLDINDPSILIFVFSNRLLESNYSVKIETYLTISTTHVLKKLRTSICPITLNVIE